jgi:MFS family permease
VLVLWLVAFADSFVHNCFFNWTGRFLGSEQVGIPSNWIMPVMSIGQVAEILTMLVLGAVLKRLGWRWTLVVGVLGHAVRFYVFAHLPEHAWLIVTVNVLHGVCYAFFFATVYLFVDAYLPQDIRSSAQGLFNLMILGGGALLANSLCPWLIDEVYTVDGVTDFHRLFEVPMWTALGAALFLMVLFRPPGEEGEGAAS